MSTTSKAKPWPTALNPCTRHPHYQASTWWCNGRVTKLCNACVYELEKKLEKEGSKDARYSALKTFKPDPAGAICTRDS